MEVAGQPRRMLFDKECPPEIIYYCPLGERFRYAIREWSREVTLVSDIIEIF